MPAARRIHAVVTGRVQGVGYRWATLEHAEGAGVSGWVRNRPDGTVELEAQGPAERLDELARWLRSGPRWAEVTAVEVREIPARADDSGFEVR
ncbi:acylphosphatase [Schumannella soli]|uniref:acylphosphatase n=1 Tax=Schumannella soli TaxID=2590779 RepID=A0A506Y4W0_9MICO|nr:acylphosphatase [Schumannella soli]TPW76058.1 acylphosphatase [Schumannella soli]